MQLGLQLPIPVVTASRGSVQPHHHGTALGLLQGMFLSLGFKPWETAADLVDLYLLLGCTFQVCSDLLQAHISKEQVLSVNAVLKIIQVVALSLNFYL